MCNENDNRFWMTKRNLHKNYTESGKEKLSHHPGLGEMGIYHVKQRGEE